MSTVTVETRLMRLFKIDFWLTLKPVSLKFVISVYKVTWRGFKSVMSLFIQGSIEVDPKLKIISIVETKLFQLSFWSKSIILFRIKHSSFEKSFMKYEHAIKKWDVNLIVQHLRLAFYYDRTDIFCSQCVIIHRFLEISHYYYYSSLMTNFKKYVTAHKRIL